MPGGGKKVKRRFSNACQQKDSRREALSGEFQPARVAIFSHESYEISTEE
jgi:hypothetical protein